MVAYKDTILVEEYAGNYEVYFDGTAWENYEKKNNQLSSVRMSKEHWSKIISRGLNRW